MSFIDEQDGKHTRPVSYKEEAIKAAKELLYDKKYIEQLEAAETDDEITRIMTTARHSKGRTIWD